MNKFFKAKFEIFFFLFILITSLFATSSVYFFRFNGPPIRSDGLGYYVYLPATFIYKDISLNKFIDAYSKHYQDPISNTWNGATKYEDTNNYLNKYPVGVAVMSAPFFIIAHITTLVLNNFINLAPDGFSSYLYHAAQSFSGTFYAVLGLYILKRILDKYFKPKTVYLTLIAITFGTNLFHYFTYDASFSHAYSFFSIALFLLLTIRWHKYPNVTNSILIGITSGLITIVRPTNIVLIILFLLWGISINKFKMNIKDRFNLYIKNYKKLILILISGLIVVFIQLLYWYLITGKFFVYSYGEEGFNFTNPQITNVLFSIRKGLFFWSPVLLLIFPGLILLYKKLKKEFLSIVIVLIINLWIVASWWHWPYGGSFGMRALIDIFPIMAIPLGLSINWILELKNKKLKLGLISLIIISIVFTIFFMIQYWRGYVPIDGSNLETILNVVQNKKGEAAPLP